MLSGISRPVSRGSYIPNIDGLRFIAIVAVMMQHLSERLLRFSDSAFAEAAKDDSFAFFISRGTIGVFLFFAISGMVIALPFGRAYLANGRPGWSLKEYYTRRLWRIEPPYFIWMSVFALILLIKSVDEPLHLLGHWVAGMTYTHYWWYGSYNIINPVAWSLEVEIQFYLLAPFLANAYFRIPKVNLRRAVLGTFIFMWITLAYFMNWMHFPGKASLLGQLPHFLTGFFLADWYLQQPKEREISRHLLWDVAALIAFPVMAYTWTTEWWKNIVFALALVVFMIAAFRGRFFAVLLRKPWLVATGGMCYTLYLIPLPMMEAWMQWAHPFRVGNNYWLSLGLQALLLLPVIWMAGVLGFRLLEKPFMRKNWPSLWIQTLREHSFGKRPQLHRAAQLTVLLAFLATTVASAQQADAIAAPKLVAFERLLESALSQAAVLKANTIDMEQQKLALKIQQRSWADLITVSGTGITGSGVLADVLTDARGSTLITTGRQNSGINLSLSLRLTGGDVINRRQENEVARLQIDRLQVEREAAETAIKTQLLEIYLQLELAVTQLKIKAESLENMALARTVAEQYFKEGQYPPSEYSTLLMRHNEAQSLFEESKAQIVRLSSLLELLAGRPVWQ